MQLLSIMGILFCFVHEGEVASMMQATCFIANGYSYSRLHLPVQLTVGIVEYVMPVHKLPKGAEHLFEIQVDSHCEQSP